jgi:hypothetical protein
MKILLRLFSIVIFSYIGLHAEREWVPYAAATLVLLNIVLIVVETKKLTKKNKSQKQP